MSTTPPADLPPPIPPPPVADATRPWNQPEARPGDDHRIDLTLLDGIVLVAWSLLGQPLIGIVIGLVAVAFGADVVALSQGRPALVLLIIVQSGVLAGALAWLAGRNRLTWRLLGSRRPRARHVAQGVGFGLLTVVVALVVAYLGTLVTGSEDTSGQALLDPELIAGPAFWLVLLAVGLLAPASEELIFRGALFQTLGRRMGWIPGMVVSSIVFAVVHVEVVLSGGNAVVFLLALGVVGALMAWTFHRTRSLVAAMVAHATFNSVQLFLQRYESVLG